MNEFNRIVYYTTETERLDQQAKEEAIKIAMLRQKNIDISDNWKDSVRVILSNMLNNKKNDHFLLHRCIYKFNDWLTIFRA